MTPAELKALTVADRQAYLTALNDHALDLQQQSTPGSTSSSEPE